MYRRDEKKVGKSHFRLAEFYGFHSTPPPPSADVKRVYVVLSCPKWRTLEGINGNNYKLEHESHIGHEEDGMTWWSVCQPKVLIGN